MEGRGGSRRSILVSASTAATTNRGGDASDAGGRGDVRRAAERVGSCGAGGVAEREVDANADAACCELVNEGLVIT